MPTPPKPAAPMKRLVILTEPQTHAQRLAKATKALTEAEALLRIPGAKRQRFLATFRLSKDRSATKGTYEQRREHLITRIEALNGVEHHVSTSAWSMLTYHTTRDIVLAALLPAIDMDLDYLEVERTGGPVHAGISRLKS